MLNLAPHDGRQTSSAYQVIWLLHKTYAQAIVAQQMTQVHVTLVRTGTRYGLRVFPTDAEQVHSQHRPDLPYLRGEAFKKYRVGPLPYGTSKASISQICKQWSWNARPISPSGQSPDKSGVLWILQASEDPSRWVYQLAHGDVLISPIDSMKAIEPQHTPVLASARTLQMLKLGRKDTTSEESSADPWAHYDPWQGARSSKPTQELTVSQYPAIEANLAQRLTHKLKQEDSDMSAVDVRVSELELKMEQLQATVQTNQVQQQQQAQAVQQQLVQLDRKVDSQLGAINETLIPSSTNRWDWDAPDQYDEKAQNGMTIHSHQP